MLVFFTVMGNHGLLHLKEINNEVRILEKQNTQLESKIVDLNNKLYSVMNSEVALEKVAREEFGLGKPGEIVYIFEEGEKD